MKRFLLVLLPVVVLMACRSVVEEEPQPTPTPTASLRALVDLYATAQQLDPEGDLTIARTAELPPGYDPELPDLDELMEPWGLQASALVVEDLPDGGIRLVERWSGAVAGPGVLWIPALELRLDGPDGVLRVFHPELLIRIGEDPEGALPEPAPAELSVLPAPEPTPEPGLAEGVSIALVVGVVLVWLLVGWLLIRKRRGMRPAPVLKTPREQLRAALVGDCDLGRARSLAAAFLSELGGLAPGKRDAVSLTAAAERVGWPPAETVSWFDASRDAVYGGSDDVGLLDQLRSLAASAAPLGSEQAQK